MRQKVSGFCDFHVDIFGNPTDDNEDMHENLCYQDMRKYYRCSDCDRVAKEVE